MKRAKLLQELLIFRFEEAYQGWREKRLTQEDAARLLGVSDRTFRLYLIDYKEHGLQGLVDHRLSQVYHEKAPVNEIMEITELYSNKYFGWNIKHLASFYWWKHNGTRCYTWIKKSLQNAGLF